MAHDIFFSADWHAGHGNIIGHCNRPFANAWEMTEKLIENYNAVVKPKDEFYHNGDFSMYSPGRTIEILKRLNGKKHMILGNHDKVLRKEQIQYYVEWVKDYHRLKVQDQSVKGGNQIIVLSHYAMRVWDQSHRGSWQLYGHSHSKLPDDPKLLSIDVGVDGHGFKPLSYDEIKTIMQKRGSV